MGNLGFSQQILANPEDRISAIYLLSQRYFILSLIPEQFKPLEVSYILTLRIQKQRTVIKLIKQRYQFCCVVDYYYITTNMSNFREQSEWTAEQALAYITGIEAADEESQYEAFATAYNYFMNLSKKKISWSVHLEKLAYEFIELAFDNNKHTSIKDVLKAYRSLTQGQHFQSLKDVLEHYRDRKLQTILQEDILHENIDLICSLPNIDNEEASSTVIFSSFKPEEKKKIEQLKHKLKIVWEGYKYIIETVRINQKLQDVYKETLSQVFDFVDKYNRKHEFKSFCRTLRSGLMTAFSKRDRSEQQKGFYIDIEKTDVNDRNIDIRLEQFKVTIKLGLWQEAFQVLEDINNLMNVRKGPVKSKIKFKYFQNLAILFRKSGYWHYHAFAYYNYYLAAQKNPNLTVNQRKTFSDKLLLSVISIPPVPLESNQRMESQRKISSMMISSNKIPSKNELYDIIVSAGIVENASAEIRNLWNFMFLEFNLQSLTKGLDFLNQVKGAAFEEFKLLIEDILIFKQLLSISQIYQKIKIESLLTMIPLPRSKIEKILLDSYHQKLLEFTLDENQKIIIFEDKSSEKAANPTENFLSIYIDLALEKEKQRKMDGAHIIKKAQNFLETSEEYYWNIRPYKIQEFRKKMKKPKQQLENEAYRLKVLEKERAEQDEFDKRQRQQQAMRLADQKKREFGIKKIVISDIRDIKQHRVVRIIGKKVEDLTDDEIENITVDTLNTHLEQLKQRIQNTKDNKFRKAFSHVDYLERQRRIRICPEIKSSTPTEEQQNQNIAQISKNSKADFEEKKLEKEKIQKMMQYLEPKIVDEENKMSDKYDQELQQFKEKLNNYFKEKIINRAKALAAENKKKKEEEQRRMREAQTDYDYYSNTKWTFKSKGPASTATGAVEQQSDKPIGGFSGFKMGSKRDQPATSQPQSSYARVQEKKQQNKESKGWARKADKEQKPAEPVVSQSHSFVPPVAQSTEKKRFGAVGGLGFNNTAVNKETKEGEDKPRPKKSYVNVN